jgi:hypothetical protein
MDPGNFQIVPYIVFFFKYRLGYKSLFLRIYCTVRTSEIDENYTAKLLQLTFVIKTGHYS